MSGCVVTIVHCCVLQLGSPFVLLYSPLCGLCNFSVVCGLAIVLITPNEFCEDLRLCKFSAGLGPAIVLITPKDFCECVRLCKFSSGFGLAIVLITSKDFCQCVDGFARLCVGLSSHSSMWSRFRVFVCVRGRACACARLYDVFEDCCELVCSEKALRLVPLTPNKDFVRKNRISKNNDNRRLHPYRRP